MSGAKADVAINLPIFNRFSDKTPPNACLGIRPDIVLIKAILLLT